MSEYSESYVADEDYIMLLDDQRELIDSYFDTYEAEDDSLVSVSAGGRNKKKDELMKQMDKGFAILHPKSKNPIAYFHTDTNPGSTIRNAVTGMYESGYKFGSANEDLFFKVGQRSCGSGNHILFYDSPEQYEKHFRTTIHDDMKKKWTEKSAIQRHRRDSPPRSNLPTIVK
jgi:hypothetical protein